MADETLDELGSAASLLRGLAEAPGSKGALVAGDVVADQYEIERPLGEGGMCVVYLARDRRLGRDVALKLGRATSSEGVARGAREAAALAQLSHPNVVVVHQVGEHDGRIFFAMEHVAGGTAREWARETERSWREIVAIYCAAGDGLAAAHEAGLVHRDFKPDNVLIGRDGRARVADFGLARAVGAQDVAIDPRESPAATTITRTGAILGTPAYMAPEQLAGDDVDARADQFAFCAALWEALYGARPFVGDTPAEVKAAIESSAPRVASGPRARRVPRHVEHALRRGLDPDPAKRWPSMTALVAELRRDPARTRRMIAAAAIVPIGIAAAIAVPRMTSADRSDPCAGGAERIARAWSPSRAAEVKRAFERLHLAWTAPAAAAVADGLDRDARAWIAADRAVCEGGPAWTEGLRERATACLARRRDELDAIATVLAAADPAVAANARTMVGSLASPSTCADRAYVASEIPPPSDPALARAVAALAPLSTRVGTLVAAGHPLEARRLGEALLPAATALGYAPLIAEAHANLGGALESADEDAAASKELKEAYFGARAVHDARTALIAAVSNVQADMGLTKFDDAAEWARLADAEARDVADPELRFMAESAKLTIARHNREPGALPLADAHVAAARALANPARIAKALRQRAQVLENRSEYDRAIEDLKEAVRVTRDAYGDDASSLIMLQVQLGYSQKQTGRIDDAIATSRESLARAERVFGVDSLVSLDPLGTLADALGASGHLDEAAQMWERILRIDVAARGPEASEYSSDLNNYGLVLAGLGRNDDALAALDHATALAIKIYGPESREAGIDLGNVAEVQLAAGKLAEAEATCDRALAIIEKLDDEVSVGYIVAARGIARRQRGNLAGSRADLERALAIREKPGGDPSLTADSRYQLAVTLAAQGERARARQLLDLALAAFRTTGSSDLAAAEALAKQLAR
ncbi:MAG TPA: serine/threonine-protein kinase [Kofleriaceae bacterium]|nr:serine/threonine-protein kinase [Kofleriaceae bacterium]